MLLTRRAALQLGAHLGGGALLACRAAGLASDVARMPIGLLPRGDVTLLDGRARAQGEATLQALLDMDDTMLLRPFRERAGLPIAPRELGGWYDFSPAFDPPRNMTGFIPGHSFGQYVSALARGYAAFGDSRARAKVDRLIAGFAPLVTPAFYRDYPLPAYTYDKILVGLLDASRLAGNRQALALVEPATRAALPSLPGRALDRQIEEKRPHPNPAFGWDETYTLPENLYLAAEYGAGDQFRRMARDYLLDDAYFFPLADGRNVLPHRHAYSHMNALASAMKAYEVDGDPRHLAAARNGMRFIAEQSFATGGWGPNEGFVDPSTDALGKSIETTHASFEAPCGTYGHFKVARYLLRATGDSRYGDGMERLLYNAALGVLPLKPDGTAFYYADYNEAGRKTYSDQICPCCSGTIGQLTADYGTSAVLSDERGLLVNLYLPLRATWRQGGEPRLTLTQRGSYPLDDGVTMIIDAPHPVRMALRLRIPAWAGPATAMAVNGRAQPDMVAGRFAVVDRLWHAGDRIDLRIERPLRAEAVDRFHPNRVAMMQGPLALFATGDAFAAHSTIQLQSLRQSMPGGGEWRFAGSDDSPIFRPYFAIGTEPTRLYQQVA